NAYVSGLGSSKRVVLWDTLLNRMNDDEVLFVFGHELGHYALGHVWKGIVLGVIALAFALWILSYLLTWALARWGALWGVFGHGDWAALAVLLLLGSIVSFAATPVANGVSRYFEHQADVFGLEVIHGVVQNAPQVAARADQILGEEDLEEPNPSAFTVFWFYTHPPIARRLEFSLHYNPWGEGRSPEFVK
ncbi:MAG: M48 family metalloprotease, partial [Bryobacteraceae bacterium]